MSIAFCLNLLGFQKLLGQFIKILNLQIYLVLNENASLRFHQQKDGLTKYSLPIENF